MRIRRLDSRGFSHWIIPLVVILLIGAMGSYILLHRGNAETTALSYEDCHLLGRNFDTGTHVCHSYCLPNAGTYTNAPVYNYCSLAVSYSVGKTECTNLGRKTAVSGGCDRHWNQTAGGNYSGAAQCLGNNLSGGPYTYHAVAGNGYDYCDQKAGQPSVDTGSDFVGHAGFGPGNCVDYIKWVLANHSGPHDGHPGYKAGETLADGRYVASTLGGSPWYYNVNHRPAIHAVVSMTSSQSAGHVALVSAIHSNGDIVVEEYNWKYYNAYDTRLISANDASYMTYAHTEAGWH